MPRWAAAACPLRHTSPRQRGQMRRAEARRRCVRRNEMCPARAAVRPLTNIHRARLALLGEPPPHRWTCPSRRRPRVPAFWPALRLRRTSTRYSCGACCICRQQQRQMGQPGRAWAQARPLALRPLRRARQGSLRRAAPEAATARRSLPGRQRRRPREQERLLALSPLTHRDSACADAAPAPEARLLPPNDGALSPQAGARAELDAAPLRGRRIRRSVANSGPPLALPPLSQPPARPSPRPLPAARWLVYAPRSSTVT